MTITYAIKITNPGATGAGAGFIDSTPLAAYGGSPTEQNAINKRRGNIRFKSIVMAVGMVSNPMITNLSFPDADFDEEPTEVNMLMTFVSPESLYINRNGTEYFEEDALAQMIAEVMSNDILVTTDYYSPDKVSAVAEVNVGKLAASTSTALTFITVDPI